MELSEMGDQARNKRQQRFSDHQLVRFHNDFIEHVKRFDNHEAEEQNKHEQLIAAQQANTAAIKQLSDDTKELLNAWTAAQGAVKVGTAMGRVFRWLSGLAVLGGFLTWLANHGPK